VSTSPLTNDTQSFARQSATRAYLGLLFHTFKSFILFCYRKMVIHYFGATASSALLHSTQNPLLNFQIRSVDFVNCYLSKTILNRFLGRVNCATHPLCLGLLLYTPQSFITFCYRKIYIHFASCFFEFRFAPLYAKSAIKFSNSLR
jgi:hypothetical protein